MRIIAVKEGKHFKVYVNPKFSPVDRPVEKLEYCLSHPGKAFKTYRARKIQIYAEATKSKALAGLEAHAFQHEIDHLDGVLV